MKYIKLFENFTNKDWKKNILEKTDILEILYDIKNISLEKLDIRDTDDEDNILEKTLYFNVTLENEDGDLITLLNGYFNYSQDQPIENYFDWTDDTSIITKDATDIPDLINNEKIKISIDFGIITGFDEGDAELTDDNSYVYNRISKMYDYVKFDIINPWDL
jgi:hypothetical protein